MDELTFRVVCRFANGGYQTVRRGMTETDAQGLADALCLKHADLDCMTYCVEED